MSLGLNHKKPSVLTALTRRGGAAVHEQPQPHSRGRNASDRGSPPVAAVTSGGLSTPPPEHPDFPAVTVEGLDLFHNEMS